MAMSNGCPKCQGSMREGALVDTGYGTYAVTAFQPGVPEVSSWFGLKVKKKTLIPTRAMRCERCSFVELYAPTPRA